MEPYFDHEKLREYQEALKFVGLIRKTSPDRVCESSVVYQTVDNENDKDNDNESITIFLNPDYRFK